MAVIKVEIFTIKLSAELSSVVWVAIGIFFLSFAITAQYMLPARFFFDSKTIADEMETASTFRIGDSFESTAYFYKIFGISGGGLSGVILSIIDFILCFAFFVGCIKDSGKIYINGVILLIICYFSFVMCVFTAVLSKDFLVLILMYTFWISLRWKVKGMIFWTALSLIYALYFRAQWAILVFMFWGCYLSVVCTKRKFWICIFIIFAFCVLGIAFNFALGVSLDFSRTVVNAVRLLGGVEDLNTMIVPYLHGGGVVAVVNVMITFIFLLFPLPLALLGAPYYLFNFLLVTVIFSLVIGSFWQYERKNFSSTMAPCFAMIMAMVATQSLYEPDYGSYLRHLCPIMPIIIHVILLNVKTRLLKK